jgi:AbrB family looped-hinge helix DNA binding protein
VKEKEISLVKVTRKGQVTIHQKTWERFGIGEGGYLVVTEVNDLVILRKFLLPSWDELFAYGLKFAAEEDITREGILTTLRAVRRGT